jgi:APA family basic amino acid/polyamine antiporter
MAERIPRESSLRRVHGVGALFAAAYGNVGSSIYYALGVVAGYALGLTPLTFMISGLIFAATAATYIEATVMYPEAGGSSSFARHAFNELVSFVAGWGQMLNYIITAAISAFAVLHYLAVFWSPLGDAPWDVVGSIVVIALLAALNVKGTQESAKLNLVLAIGDLLTQVVLVGIGIALVLSPQTLIDNIHLGVAPSWGNFALGIAVGMVAYTGIETISNMAEEARDAERTVVRSTQLVVVAVIGLYALLPIVALSAMPVVHDAAGHYTTELGTRFANDPVLGIVQNIGLSHGLTSVLRYYVGVLAAVILLIATNAGLIGLSRLTYSMGHHRQLPEMLRRIHPRFGTPYIAIIVFSIVAALAILPGQLAFLATMYSFGAMLSFTIAHVSVLRLRARQSERERAWKPPMNVRFRGVDWPLTAVFGGLGTFLAWVIVMVLDVKTLVAGVAWMAMGIALYVFYRRSQGLPLTKTVKVATLEPLGVKEVEYESVLVPFELEPFSEEAITTAARLAGRRRGAIHVLSLIPVPTQLPLDAPLEKEESEAQSKIQRAKLIAGGRVSGSVARVRPGGAGKRIVDVAKASKASAIVMPLSYRDGKPLYGQTLKTVLAKRPTRVLVAATPAQAQRDTIPV